uniref:Protein phosphatase 1 regulatory subunit 26 N-terminal domain-containing protein n=1 Tax=Oryzias latipes TaxID=8090 RepID=A0A3P9M2X0_ORYLA
MYLMNVPPVAATQTEWRRCGPPGGFSLPICFNDSDTELSTRDTPISDKVQMIIDSLRSTQSSLDMGDEIEGNVLPGQDGRTQACAAAVGSYVEKKSKAKSPPENQQTRPPAMNNHDSSDSDSDGSVDRGIEEAILEYLKEKDDHKRKADSDFLHSAKIPRQHPPILGIFKHNSDSHLPLISCNQIPRMIKAETLTTPTTIPLKKYLKNKASLDENFNLDKSPSTNLASTNEPIQTSSKPTGLFSKTTNTVVKFKVEEDTTDSSSDDGIEEAIQKYQLEKKGQQNQRETLNPSSFKEESDSTSDDGIEEAIRCYQLEQQKEKPVLKSFLDRQKPLKKSLEHPVGGTSSESTSKLKLKKKHSRADKQATSSNNSLSVVGPKPTLSQSSKGKGNSLLCFRPEPFEEQPAYTPPKVNTTAELMCAEAILDISKTVMPGAFHHSLSMNSCGPTKSSEQPLLSISGPIEGSEDSSIDSEDGIEQEIRKFLEQKAQMHKQSPGSQDITGVNETEKLRAKEVQKKPQRLSLTHRRKQKVAQSMLGTDQDKKSPAESAQESAELPSRGATQAIVAVQKTDRGGDKSSSLDSDEDLDTAIKDLLKTKKKSKKKIRDLKRKPRKFIQDEEPASGNSLPTKKFKSEPFFKCSTLTKPHKQKEELKDELGFIKKNVSQQKQTDQSRTETQKDGKELPHVQEKDDSSSVDSDDSIEQEIRKFLAEKAKVSTTEKTKDGDVSRNGTVIVQAAGIKQESQLAEVSTKSPPLGSLSFPVPDTTPQRLQSVISPGSAQPRASSLQPSAPSLLEPADGAGAARVEQGRASVVKKEALEVVKTAGRGHPIFSPNLSHSSAEANKWRQSLGLPLYDTKAVSRTPFLINTSEIKGTTTSSTFSNQNKGPKLQTSAGSWFASKTGRAPASCSKETDANPTVRPPVLNFYSAARQHPTTSFAQSLLPGHSSQFSQEKASTVHVPKDKSVFVELETNRTNHVQVQSRERREGNERAQMPNDRKAEGKSMKIDVSTDRKEEEEEFIDETDCESDGRKDPGKKQGFSALSLCRTIDPGISISPCIALTSEERSRMFRRRYLVRKHNKGGPSLVPLQFVKRKLDFVAESRKTETRTLQSGRW